jgi:hypothetical protein
MATKRTPKREQRFLEVLARSGSIEQAAKAAGFGRASAFRWRAADASFAARWEAAYEAGTDRLEDVSVDIATQGFVEYRETVTAKDGTVTVTERRKLSERHLELQLKARRPEKYRERVQQELVGAGNSPIQQISDVTDMDRARALFALLNKVRVLTLPAPTVATEQPITEVKCPSGTASSLRTDAAR